MRWRRLPLWIYLLVGLVLAGLVGIVIWQLNQTDSGKSSGAAPSLIDQSTLSELATTDTPIDRSHLADGLTPPTNKWFSGFTLQAEPKPGYNYPNSFLPKNDGFEFSLPKVQATDQAMTGTHAPDVVVTIDQADNYKVTDYDELTVELTYYDELDQAVATVRLASGLPYVYVSAEQSTEIDFSGQAEPQDSWTRLQSNDMNYGINTTSEDNRFSLEAGQNVSFFSAPSRESLQAVAEQAGTIVQSGSVSYEQRGDSFQTTLSYDTLEDQPVLFARLPHQQSGNQSDLTYRSVLGDMTTEVGREFSFQTPTIPVTDQLDLSDISQQERNQLVEQLGRDVADFEDNQDTYFGGKQLQRMAQLLLIAEQLDQDELASTARDTLKRQLESWLTLGKTQPKSFAYDPAMHGIVGNVASFGSDKEFNDHHFHYGYFIYAAAILAQHDDEFLETHRDTVNLLVADIANYNTNEDLPLRRSFDAYAGHSWASGTSPFLDGNNQESTSEAINAWVGTSLWAQQIDNQPLQLQADWMLSQEHSTTQTYWLMQGDAPDYLSDYVPPLASIVWGAKREYSTFFSDEANAKLAIQLLPLTPTMKSLDRSLPDELLEGTSVDQTYGDHILMAQSDATLEEAVDLPDSAIDDGNSRTYLYAYILSRP